MSQRVTTAPIGPLRKAVLAALLLSVVTVVATRFAYRDLLQGPALVPTPDSLSLTRDLPAAVGWSPQLIESARVYADGLPSQSVIVLWRGMVAVEWGDTSRRIDLDSMGESLLGGRRIIAVDRGLIDLEMTLAELGVVDHSPSLSSVERSARIEDLITSRSGIYHSAVGEDLGQFPERGIHVPNQTFFYNLWNFNLAASLFEQLTDISLGQAFKDWIADPVGMQDFRTQDVTYQEGGESNFRSWHFSMSARDIARFGQLYMQGGRWDDVQIIPSNWIADTLTRHSDAGDGIGYGYLWWIMADGSFLSTGTGGQVLQLYPEDEVMVVYRLDTGTDFARWIWTLWGRSVTNAEISSLVRRVMAAGPG